MSRSSIHGATVQHEEPASIAIQRAPTPEWKRQLLQKRSEDTTKPSGLSPERKDIINDSPTTGTSGVSFVSTKRSTAKPYTSLQPGSFSQRSTSKPVSGTVRSIAARFDSASQESTPIQVPNMSAKPQSNFRGSQNSPSQSNRAESFAKTEPIKVPLASRDLDTSSPITLTEKPAASTIRSIPAKTGSIPGRFRASISRLGHSLRPGLTRGKSDAVVSRAGNIIAQPVQPFIAARNEPQATPSRMPQRKIDSSGPLSFGTTLQFPEQPQGARPLDECSHIPVTTMHNHTPSEASDDVPVPETHRQRLVSGDNSHFGQQTQSLQQQVDYRNKEVQCSYRQLCTPYTTDPGTLAEQLQRARQECKMWRERAEAAEKHVMVLETCNSDIRGLREANTDVVNLDGWQASAALHLGRSNQNGDSDNVSTYSNHTEDREVFNERTRNSLMMKGSGAGVAGGINSSETELDLSHKDTEVTPKMKKPKQTP